MRLTLRLESLLARCQPGLPLWDLCCDHGYLGLWALKSGAFPQVMFNDVVPHLLDLIKPKLRETPAARLILGHAEDIAEPLTGNVIIAGVGGEKIYKILSSHGARGSLNADNIVVCPEKDAEWLSQKTIFGFCLSEKVTIPHGKGERWILTYSPDGHSHQNY